MSGTITMETLSANTPQGNVARIRLLACYRGAELTARTGMKLARNQPTVAALRKQYGIKARTNSDAATELVDLLAEATRRAAAA